MCAVSERVYPWLCVCVKVFTTAALVITVCDVLVEEVVIGHLSSAASLCLVRLCCWISTVLSIGELAKNKTLCSGQIGQAVVHIDTVQ